MINYSVTGANTQAGFAITDANGLASFTYAADNAGTDSIVSFIGNLSDVVNVDWEGVSPTVTISLQNLAVSLKLVERFCCPVVLCQGRQTLH